MRQHSAPAPASACQVVRAGVELGVWTSLGYLLQSEGLLTTDASRASFLSTFTVSGGRPQGARRQLRFVGLCSTCAVARTCRCLPCACTPAVPGARAAAGSKSASKSACRKGAPKHCSAAPLPLRPRLLPLLPLPPLLRFWARCAGHFCPHPGGPERPGRATADLAVRLRGPGRRQPVGGRGLAARHRGRLELPLGPGLWHAGAWSLCFVGEGRRAEGCFFNQSMIQDWGWLVCDMGAAQRCVFLSGGACGLLEAGKKREGRCGSPHSWESKEPNCAMLCSPAAPAVPTGLPNRALEPQAGRGGHAAADRRHAGHNCAVRAVRRGCSAPGRGRRAGAVALGGAGRGRLGRAALAGGALDRHPHYRHLPAH